MGRKFDARLDTVPLSPGVYLMKDSSGTVIYVGKAKKLRNRLKSYFGGGPIAIPKVAAMVSHVADFEYTVVGSEPEALLLEANLIKRYQPRYNILLRDDKGYPYICVTLNEQYPRVFKAFRPEPEARKAGGAAPRGRCGPRASTARPWTPACAACARRAHDTGKARPRGPG